MTTKQTGRILLILPRAKAAQLENQLDEIEQALGPAGSVIREIADDPDRMAMRIVELSNEVDQVAVGGGDGTLSSVAPAFMQTGLPMVILPLGTANDLARTLGIPRDLIAAAELARTGRLEDIDVGEVNGHTFYNAASIGLSVDVAERLEAGPKRYGVFSYLLTLLDLTRARRNFRAYVTCDGELVTLNSIQLTVGNGVRHGGGVRVHADASIDDGRLDLYSLEPQPLWRLPILFPAFMRGTHNAWRSVTNLRAREFHVETPAKPKRVNADGEIVSRTPATFKLHRNAVWVRLPPSVEP
ncbi:MULTISPECIES: lipid kinase [Alphaproteobacteria]|uniref:lipid kinase n=1 Tax=Alphaproteobacteria TaxID=28211 RepID=UPI0004B33D0F|nr:lipid kinase [Rhodovibrio salinarum]